MLGSAIEARADAEIGSFPCPDFFLRVYSASGALVNNYNT